jgi:hypothetical protein
MSNDNEIGQFFLYLNCIPNVFPLETPSQDYQSASKIVGLIFCYAASYQSPNIPKAHSNGRSIFRTHIKMLSFVDNV